jgi:hypothetical protein
MKRIYAILFIVLLSLSLQSCNKRNPSSVQQRNIVKIDSTISITLREVLGIKPRNLMFDCVTTRFYPETPNYILYQFHPVIPHYILFNGVDRTNAYYFMFGPGECTIPMGVFVNGKAPFFLNINNIVQACTLLATDYYYEVLNGNGPWTMFEYPKIMFVPENTIWGYCGGSLKIANEYADSLLGAGAQTQAFSPGHYSHFFDIDSLGSIVSPPGWAYGFDVVYPYIFRCSVDTHRINAIVHNFGIRYPDSIYIWHYDWKGNSCYSWF